MKVSSYTNKQLSTKIFLYINYWEESIFFAGLFLCQFGQIHYLGKW